MSASACCSSIFEKPDRAEPDAASSSRCRAWPTSWKRIDDRTVELTLRKGVKFHNGDEMTAEDVVFTFGRERMFGTGATTRSTSKTLFTTVLTRDSVEGKKLPPEVPARRQAHLAVAREGRGGRQVHGALRQPRARRHARGPHRRARQRDHQPPRLRGGQDLARLGAQAGRHRPLQGARVQARRVADPRRARRLLGRPAADQDASASSWCPRSRAASTACCPASIEFACDIPPDQIAGIEKNAAFEVQGGTDPQPSHHRVRQEPSAARRSARAPGDHPCDRPPGDRRQPVGRPHARAAGPAVGILRRRCSSRTGRCRSTTAKARRRC